MQSFTLFVSDGWELTGHEGEVEPALAIPDYKITSTSTGDQERRRRLHCARRCDSWRCHHLHSTVTLRFTSGAKTMCSACRLTSNRNEAKWQLTDQSCSRSALRQARELHGSLGSMLNLWMVPASGSFATRLRMWSCAAGVRRDDIRAGTNPFKKGFWEINSTTPATSSAPTTGSAPLSQVISIWGENRVSSCATSATSSDQVRFPGSTVLSISTALGRVDQMQ